MGTQAGVTSWHPERLGSQDWTLTGLRELGTTCHQSRAPWTCKDWSPLDGTTISRCRWALQKLHEAQSIQRLVGPQAGRASKSQQVSWTCPGEGTQHQPRMTSPQQSGFAGAGICLWGEGVKERDTGPWAFLLAPSAPLTTQELTDFPEVLAAQVIRPT